jgi:anti-anti-sigma regulatory factor
MHSGYHLIRLSGQLDISRYPDFREVFDTAPERVPVLLDLTSAESVDSFFLGEMLLFKRRHDALVVVLIPPLGYIARVFELTNLDAKVDVFHDLSLAIGALGIETGNRGAAPHEPLDTL